MRIIAGKLRGMRLHTPEKGAPTRPTTDRAREAIFSALGPRIRDASYLDLFSGTGANGLEAISRGARRAVLVEKHPKALRCIRKNLGQVSDATGIQVVSWDVQRYLAKTEESFDLIFADPPFDLCPKKVLSWFADSKALAPEGLLVLEYRRDRSQKKPVAPEAPAGLYPQRTYSHGEAGITFYSSQEPTP